MVPSDAVTEWVSIVSRALPAAPALLLQPLLSGVAIRKLMRPQ